jgi:hypothetical protein
MDAEKWPKEPVNPNPPVKADGWILHENRKLVQKKRHPPGEVGV